LTLTLTLRWPPQDGGGGRWPWSPARAGPAASRSAAPAVAANGCTGMGQSPSVGRRTGKVRAAPGAGVVAHDAATATGYLRQMARYDVSTRSGLFSARGDYVWKDHAFLRRWFMNAHWLGADLVRFYPPPPRQLADW